MQMRWKTRNFKSLTEWVHSGMHISPFILDFDMMMSMRVLCLYETLTYSIDRDNGTHPLKHTHTMNGIYQFIGILISLHYTDFQTKQNKSISLRIENDAFTCIIQYVYDVFRCISLHCIACNIRRWSMNVTSYQFQFHHHLHCSHIASLCGDSACIFHTRFMPNCIMIMNEMIV